MSDLASGSHPKSELDKVLELVLPLDPRVLDLASELAARPMAVTDKPSEMDKASAWRCCHLSGSLNQ